jgi:excisionase family DNA binding protein
MRSSASGVGIRGHFGGRCSLLRAVPPEQSRGGAVAGFGCVASWRSGALVGRTEERVGSFKRELTMNTVKAAATKLNVCPSVVYDLVASGALPHYRIGRPGRRGAIRIADADLEAYLAGQKRETGPMVPQAPKRNIVLKHVKLKG